MSISYNSTKEEKGANSSGRNGKPINLDSLTFDQALAELLLAKLPQGLEK